MFSTDDLTQTEARRLPAPDRQLTVTPLDVRQAKFGTAMRGFDRGEVAAFLQDAAEGYEQALRENDRLRQEVARLDGALSQFRDLEGSLKNTLMSAQKLADEIRENASQEAARLVREAEGRAELIVQKAHLRAEELQRDLDGLKMKRREAEVGIEATMSALRHTLELIREHDQRLQSDRADKQDNVVQHRPRVEQQVAV